MTQAARTPSRRLYILVTLVAFALVLLPFLFWRSTWFGRRLTDAETERLLADLSKPRQTQHALVQIGERLAQGDASVRRWYPGVAALASSPVLELRQTAAWIMGQDPAHQAFHAPLLKLLTDSEPMVRRNAALALAKFGDDQALGELRAMLRPSTLATPAGGVLRYRLKPGEFVNPGTLVARAGDREIRAQLPGEVRQLLKPEGATVQPGEPIVELSSDREHAWEALRALYLIGTPAELEDVQRFARGIPGIPERLQQQASFTVRAIESRRAR
ncbi:MAG: HEAT repeat domain-containing protein [Bryobacteraceae bacterium]